VHYKVGKVNFEIGTKKGAVTAYKEKGGSIQQILDSEVIWKDIKKGDRASSAELKAAFQTDDVLKCAEAIVQKGELNLSESERKEILTKKRNEIINYIHKYYADPKTKLPHPILRIDNALNELKVRIDGDAPTERQVLDIMKTLVTILPCKKIDITGSVTVSQLYNKAATAVVQKYCANMKVAAAGDTLTITMSCVPGDYDKLINELNSATKGECDIQFDGMGQGVEVEESSKSKKSGGGGKQQGKGRGGGQAGERK